MPRKQNSSGFNNDLADAVAEQQREWFGRPLRELFGTITDLCGITQAQLADYLGISAPMVSQLMIGRRGKPGNPVVQERIAALSRAIDNFEAGRIDAEGVLIVLQSLGDNAPSRTPTVMRTAGGQEPLATVQLVRSLLASVASAAEIEGAAGLIEDEYPEIAQILRVYGTGRTADAAAHLQSHSFY